MKIMFIGGPGNISTSAAQEVIKKGNQLGIFTLPNVEEGEFSGKVKYYRGDRNSTPVLEAAINDFKPEIVVDFCCFTPLQAEQLYPIIKGKLKQFIFISSVDVYGFPLSRMPMRETDPWNPTNCEYAENKRLIEVFYQNKAGKDLPLTLIRPAYSFGNTFVLTCLTRGGGKHLIPWLRVGKPVLSCGDGTTLIHAGVAVNTGRMIARIIGTDFTIGKSYTCGHETFISNDDYIKIFAKALNVTPNIVHVPSELVLSNVDPALEGYILKVLTTFNVSFSVDAFKADFPDFNWEVTHAQAAKDYIEYNDKIGFFADARETILEDIIIENFKKAVAGFSLPKTGFTFYS